MATANSGITVPDFALQASHTRQLKRIKDTSQDQFNDTFLFRFFRLASLLLPWTKPTPEFLVCCDILAEATILPNASLDAAELVEAV
jgi:hypothetical protein